MDIGCLLKALGIIVGGVAIVVGVSIGLCWCSERKEKTTMACVIIVLITCCTWVLYEKMCGGK